MRLYRHRDELPEMESWGISEGRPPLTEDPENPIKPFAKYKKGNPDGYRDDRRG